MIGVFALGLGFIIGAILFLALLPVLGLLVGGAIKGIGLIIVAVATCIGVGLCAAVILLGALRHFILASSSLGRSVNTAWYGVKTGSSPLSGLLSIRPGKLPGKDATGWPNDQ